MIPYIIPTVMFLSLIVVFLIHFRIPECFGVGWSDSKKAISYSRTRTILLAIFLPILIGFSIAYTPAKIAACSGWVNPWFGLGLFCGVNLCCILATRINLITKEKSYLVIGFSISISFILCLLLLALTPGLSSFEELDFHHHPIFIPVNSSWVNSVIDFLSKSFPMEDFPVIRLEKKIYSPEYSFINAFVDVSCFVYLIVIVVSLYGIIRDKMLQTCKKWFNYTIIWG